MSSRFDEEDAGADAVWRLRGAPLVAGSGHGPLTGLQVAVKDVFAVAGHRIGAGVPQWLAEAPVEREHADAVRRLLAAGADVAGIAQTDQLAFSLAGANAAYGTPPNPAVPGGLPGGSSSGPASAVALHQADVGLGTDTGGSIRVPASYQGLYGLRPTHGVVDAAGLVHLAPRFDTVGWLARDPGVLLRVGRVLLRARNAVPVRRILLAPELLTLAEPAVADAVEAAARVFGHRIAAEVGTVTDVVGDDAETWLAAFRTLQLAEAERVHGSWVRAHPGALGADVAGRFAEAALVTAAEEAAAQPVAVAARERIVGRLEPGTVLAFPAASSTAPPAGQPAEAAQRTRTATLRLTCLAGLSGTPVVVLPVRTAAGPPAGLGLLGLPGSDLDLLELACR